MFKKFSKNLYDFGFLKETNAKRIKCKQQQQKTHIVFPN